MAKVFLNQFPDGRVTVSNIQMTETGATLHIVEASEEEMEKIKNPGLVTKFDGSKLSFEAAPPSEESLKKAIKDELKAKLEQGTATDGDIKTVLKLLL